MIVSVVPQDGIDHHHINAGWRGGVLEAKSLNVRWGFILAISCAALWLLATMWICRSIYTQPKVVDFLSYWAAARLAADGHGAWAYDINLHHRVEETVVSFIGNLPFPYPPAFLLVVTPFGLLPFWAAFVAWIALTGAIFAVVVGWRGRLPYIFSHPAVIANSMIGQNGFLTTSILSGGLTLLPKRPLAGGAVLGLMVIKPQLALTLPFAMIAGRQWKAIAAAIASASCALLLAWLVFGWDAYRRFFLVLPFFTDAMTAGKWPWNKVASVFALMRFLGAPHLTALAVQAFVALLVIGLVCRAWWLGLDERAPMIAAAAVLIPPYVFTYDALLLVIPWMWLLERRQSLWVIPTTWLFCVLPIANYFDFYTGPNTVPLAATLCMWALNARPKHCASQRDEALA